MNNQESATVLIVGAGPSGLMMAHELASFNIACMIIDKSMAKSPYSRAIGVQARTLEIFKTLGLYDLLIKQSWPTQGMKISAEGRPPLTIELARTTSSIMWPLIIDQPHTEHVLEQSLHRLNQKILYGVELVGYEQNDQGVIATLKDQTSRTFTQKFSYIIGTDGAHSLVRKGMNTDFLGSSYDEAFILADAELIHLDSHNYFRIFFKKKQFLALIPMFGENHYRLISVRRGETNKSGSAPSIEEFKKLIKDLLPYPCEIKNEVWVSRFFVQCRSASHYQDGRAFIVGDAAHLHSPAGGQGMNTGLQDSYNLAWKLALVIKKIASKNLLETYHQERKPVGDFLIDRTDRLFKFMIKSSIFARLLRRFVLPQLVKNKKMVEKLSRVISQVGIRYDRGARCNHDRHFLFNGIVVGERMANLEIISSHLKKTSVHEISHKLALTLLFFNPKNPSKKNMKDIMAMIHKVHEQFSSLATCQIIFSSDYDAENLSHTDYYVLNDKNFLVTTPVFVAIRPDQHVFCFGHVHEYQDFFKSVLRVFLSTG